MAQQTCPSCGGSGIQGYDIERNQTCPGCGGRGTIDVPGGSPSGANGCFPANSKILTPNGWKEIVNLSKGDAVLSVDKNNRLIQSKIIKRKKHGPQKTVRLELNNSWSLSATDVHSIFTSRGWQRIRDIKPGDKIYNFDKEKINYNLVFSVEENCDLESVYNLIVESNYTFIVQGCIAHSFTYFKYMRIAFNQLTQAIIRSTQRNNLMEQETKLLTQ